MNLECCSTSFRYSHKKYTKTKMLNTPADKHLARWSTRDYLPRNFFLIALPLFCLRNPFSRKISFCFLYVFLRFFHFYYIYLIKNAEKHSSWQTMQLTVIQNGRWPHTKNSSLIGWSGFVQFWLLTVKDLTVIDTNITFWSRF